MQIENWERNEKQKPLMHTSKLNYNNGFYYFQFYVISIVLFYIAYFSSNFFFSVFLDDFISQPDAKRMGQRRALDFSYVYIRFFTHFVNKQLNQKPKEEQWKNVLQIANVLIMFKRADSRRRFQIKSVHFTCMCRVVYFSFFLLSNLIFV